MSECDIQHTQDYKIFVGMSKKNRKEILFLLATKFAWLLILLLGKTARIRIVGGHYWRRALELGNGVLIVVWHGRILLPIYIHRKLGIAVMVSQHIDGEMIAQTIMRLGYNTIRGSSTRGGKEAFHQMVTTLKNGNMCAIMPDGPQGPRHKFKAGALYLAQRSGAYLLPMTFSASHKIQFKSWDRFIIWRPFYKCVVIYGEPFQVPKDLNVAEMVRFRKTVQQQLIELEAKADAFF